MESVWDDPNKQVPAEKDEIQPAIGLSLSGGGFRATLFHLGVVRALRDRGKLNDISHICSVSGGSILAAHLVLNWKRYAKGDDAEFARAANEVINFTRSNQRNWILIPWVIMWGVLIVFGISTAVFTLDPGWYRSLPFVFAFIFILLRIRVLCSRTDLLQKRYSGLFGDQRLADLAPANNCRPILHIMATSMTTGEAVSFDSRGVHLQTPPDDTGNVKTQHFNLDNLKINYAVAASSAFPPGFPPLRLELPIPKTQGLEGIHYLGDGGVYDNLGIHKCVRLLKEEYGGRKFKEFFVSDAEGAFSQQPPNFWQRWLGNKWLPLRASRSTNLLMERLSRYELSEASSLCNTPTQPFQIRLRNRVNMIGSKECLDESQESAMAMRTDLDSFTEEEINTLVCQGQYVARQACGALEDDSKQNAIWKPFKSVARLRFKRLRAFRFKALVTCVAGILALLCYGIHLVLSARESEITSRTEFVENNFKLVKALSVVSLKESKKEMMDAYIELAVLKKALLRVPSFRPEFRECLQGHKLLGEVSEKSLDLVIQNRDKLQRCEARFLDFSKEVTREITSQLPVNPQPPPFPFHVSPSVFQPAASARPPAFPSAPLVSGFATEKLTRFKSWWPFVLASWERIAIDLSAGIPEIYFNNHGTEDLPLQVIALAHELRDMIVHAGDPKLMAALEAKRKDLLLETSKLALDISNAVGSLDIDSKARQELNLFRLNSLYFGELCVVEGTKVESHMVWFKEAIESKDVKMIKSRAKNLTDAIEFELSRNLLDCLQ